ncbi:LacI family DNA-binding transcriptional regulator [Puniceicoccus vermicola]|uniref:LacI family DNA-binding transcriptional regulator n=1 Tax=Puniceicoccus vermicola TaxID=388746 RepID=A0A7X1B174_9BACT|nr:LacI family DNA-binding transcriptional regulator [Puniceicoccus vermicola]MBC2602638.1 LacI family DNA-binding transcriptional regulator [Puniceicoccus vermicola]
MLNQRALADQLGLSQTTVSRALRNHPSIAPATRERVWQEAQKAGYRPNPQVSALMEQIRQGRTPEIHSTIAILSGTDPKHFPRNSTTQRLYQGHCEHAQEYGYSTEVFPVPSNQKQSVELDRILYSRGIAGIIFAYSGGEEGLPIPDLHWDRYAIATVSDVFAHLPIDRASTDHQRNTNRAYLELLRRGYKRIGICLPEHSIEARDGYDNSWLSAYLACNFRRPKSLQIPVFTGTIHDTKCSRFQSWYERHRPDALITLLGEEIQWLNELKLAPPQDIGLVSLNRPPDSHLSGIDENNLQVGRAVCELVVSRLTHNQLGLPTSPRRVLVDGIWCEGETLSNPSAPIPPRGGPRV